MKQHSQVSLADLAVSRRTVRVDLFVQLEKIIDWSILEEEIERHYKKGTSVDGRRSYKGLLLFKMCLLQTWYGLSDYEVEEAVNDRISFSKFIGLSLEDKSPDHSVVSRFRKVMSSSGAYEQLLLLINEQLTAHSVLVKTGVIIDASVIPTPRKPRGKKVYEVVPKESSEDKVEELNEALLQEVIQPQVDQDARWVKKGNKLTFGYKKHVVVDDLHGLVLTLLTTAANVMEISNLEDVLKKANLPKGTKAKMDKGYKSAKNDGLLEQLGLRNHTMFKAQKNKPLTDTQKKFNKLVSKLRYKVERTFGAIKRWFDGGVARYVGIEKMHTQNLIEAIAYNLYRLPRIVVNN